MTSSEWAAWVQAIGSLLAIGATYYVSRASRNDAIAVKSAEEVARSRDLALSLMAPVKAWRNSYAAPLKRIRSGDAALAFIAAEGTISDGTPRHFRASVNLKDLGHAGKSLQTAVFIAQKLDDELPILRRHMLGDEADEATALKTEKHYAMLIRKLAEVLETAVSQMEDMFPEAKA